MSITFKMTEHDGGYFIDSDGDKVSPGDIDLMYNTKDYENFKFIEDGHELTDIDERNVFVVIQDNETEKYHMFVTDYDSWNGTDWDHYTFYPNVKQETIVKTVWR